LFINHILLYVCLYFSELLVDVPGLSRIIDLPPQRSCQNMESGIPMISYLSSGWFFSRYDIWHTQAACLSSQWPCKDLTFSIPTITCIYTNRRGDDVKI
jgi:dipeptide/tripeptide permease